MLRGILLTSVVVLVAFAGCVDNDTDADTIPQLDGTDCAPGDVDQYGVNVVAPTDNVLPTEEDDPFDFESTNYRTCTLEVVNRHPLRFDASGNPDPHHYIGELDMRGDLNLGAVAVLGNGEDPFVYILDITDRANPVVLSTISQLNTYIVDVKFSDDGRYLFTASQTIPTGVTGEFPTEPLAVTVSNGFTVYDIADPVNPSFVTFVPNVDDLGCHMLTHEIIDGTDVVFCVGQHVSAHGFTRLPTGNLVYMGAFQYLMEEGTGTVLPGACVNDIIVAGDPAGVLCSGPHDMTVLKDEVDGKVYMTVSTWDDGLRVVDVSDLLVSGFVTVAKWSGEDATHYDGNVHTAMMFWVGDKRYVVATPEMTYGGVVPSIWVLDATDLNGQLDLVAEWYHPSEPVTPGLLKTLHQWQVAPTGTEVEPEDVNIYITWNHNGLWALDFASILEGDLAGAIGGFHMSREPLNPNEVPGSAAYSTWDVNIVDGYIYGSDRATGVWIFHYTPDTLGDERLTGWA